jgi:phosphoglycerate dehydrogenase-like enzyme
VVSDGRHGLVVHYPHPPAPVLLQRLRDALPAGMRVTTGPVTPPDCSVLITGHVRPEQLSAGLRSVIVPYVGLSAPSRVALLARPELAVYALKYNGAQTAELAIALLLAAAKNLLAADRGLRDGQWRTKLPALAVAGRTALVLGHGAVGSRVAAGCAALGMRVLVVRRHGADPAAAAGGFETYPVTALPRLLPQAGAVLVCLPLTPATAGLIGGPELALLPPDAVLVNVGRAEVIEEEALFRALERNAIFAAALDVWYDEPSPLNGFAAVPGSRFPFDRLPNVLLSPHRGYRGGAAELARIDALAGLLTALDRGEPAGHRIDVEAGY